VVAVNQQIDATIAQDGRANEARSTHHH
jgi:hypothetical protein